MSYFCMFFIKGQFFLLSLRKSDIKCPYLVGRLINELAEYHFILAAQKLANLDSDARPAVFV